MKTEAHGACAVFIIPSQPFNPVFVPATLDSARFKFRQADLSLTVAVVSTPDSYSFLSRHLTTCSSLPIPIDATICTPCDPFYAIITYACSLTVTPWTVIPSDPVLVVFVLVSLAPVCFDCRRVGVLLNATALLTPVSRLFSTHRSSSTYFTRHLATCRRWSFLTAPIEVASSAP